MDRCACVRPGRCSDMRPEVRIGVVDSGHADGQANFVVGGRRFCLSDDGLDELSLTRDRLGHGSAVCEAILARAPEARLCVAQVFDERGVTSPLQLAAALRIISKTGPTRPTTPARSAARSATWRRWSCSSRTARAPGRSMPLATPVPADSRRSMTAVSRRGLDPKVA